MWAGHEEMGAFLGLLPDQARALSPIDLELYRKGEQRRFNRLLRVVAWAVGMLEPVVAIAVNKGIAASFGSKPTIEALPWHQVIGAVPHYEYEEGEKEERDVKRRLSGPSRRNAGRRSRHDRE